MIRSTRDKTSLNYARYEISSSSHGTLVLLFSLHSIMGFPITGQVNTHRAFRGCPFADSKFLQHYNLVSLAFYVGKDERKFYSKYCPIILLARILRLGISHTIHRSEAEAR